MESIGSRLASMVSELWNPIFFLITGICFIIGLVLLYKGLMKLKDASSPQHGHGSVGPGITMLVCGSLMMALPSAAGIGVSTWTGTTLNLLGSSNELGLLAEQTDYGLGKANVGDTLKAAKDNRTGTLQQVLTSGKYRNPTNCRAVEDPAKCMIDNLAENAAPAAIMAIWVVVFLTGLWLFGSTIYTIARNSATPNQHERGLGARLVVSVLMMNAPYLFYIVSNTVLGTGENGVIRSTTGFNPGSSLLTYSSSGDSVLEQRFADMFASAFVILAAFGVFAFVRGLLMVKATAEGRSNGTYGAAAVFMVSGILLANIKLTTCALAYTLGGSGMTAGFCS